jgi:hypothetical protein
MPASPATQPVAPGLTASAGTSTAQLRQPLDRLESTLRQSIDRHQQLLKLLQRKRQAVRAGDARTMTDLTRAENTQVQAISDIEKTRLQLVADLTLRVAPGATEPLKLADLAERFPEPTRGRLLVMRTQLLDAMHAVRDETVVAKRAAESLVQHVSGLVRTLAAVSHGHAAYSPIGRTPDQPAALSTLSLTA